jgi:hypothetical protein
MVDISHETASATEQRLRHVIRAAELKVYDRPYVFAEFPLHRFPFAVDPQAIALIRDDEAWSQLIPHGHGSGDQFAIFRFHFQPALDNSGFVGWLATHLKRKLGTGVFVVCGHNTARGGIFDYWGCPLSLREKAIPTNL